MRYETFGFILIGFFVLIGVAALIIILRSETNQNLGFNLGKNCLTGITIILFLILYAESRGGYSISMEMNDWAKYRTPQIDTFMFLDTWNNNEMRYYTLNPDSIRHLNKTVDYDLFFLDKIKDVFENRKENLRLQMTFIKSYLFRKQKRINVLERLQGYDYIGFDTLNVQQADSVLKAWRFTDDLYKLKTW